MADVIKRTRIGVADPIHLEQRTSVNTPLFPSVTWITNPDLSGVSGVDKKYWETSGDDVVEMNQAGKDAVNAVVLSEHNIDVEDLIKFRLELVDRLAGIPWTIDASGLTITTTINSVIIAEESVIVADPVDEKFVRVVYLYNSTTDDLTLEVLERTTGLFADPASDEKIAAVLANYSLPANGTDLVEI